MSDPKFPPQAFPPATLDRVVSSLLSGLDGFTFADGRVLTADDKYPLESPIPDRSLPYLGLFGVDASVVDYTPDVDRVTVSATLFLKVRANREQRSEKAARETFDELLVAFDRIRGLPVDADGKVVPRSLEPLWDDTETRSLLVDVNGPRITRAIVREQTGSPYSTVTISASMQYDQNREQLAVYYAKKAIVGAVVGDAAKWQVDPEWPAIAATTADTFGAGFPDTEAPSVGSAKRIDPPFPGDTEDTGAFTYGADPDDELIRVDVLPGSFSVAAAATQQLSATLVYRSGITYDGTAFVSWATSAAGVATVSSAGLVAGVAAGNATITATHLGVAGTASATVT